MRFVGAVDRFFQVSEKGSTISKELLAGCAGFLANVHLMTIVPSMLADVGCPLATGTLGFGVATVVSTALASFVTDVPILLGPGVGMAAFAQASFRERPSDQMFCFLVAGGVMVLMGLIRGPSRLYEAAPACVKSAVPAGIGLYLSLTGLQQAGLVEADEHTVARLALPTRHAALAVGGAVLMLALEHADELVCGRSLGSLITLLPIVTVSLMSWALGLATWPEGLVMSPQAVSIGSLALPAPAAAAVAIFGVLVIAFFDIAGLVLACRAVAGREEDSSRMNPVFVLCGIGTLISAALQGSPVIVFGECLVCILAGGKTGLCSLTASAMFACALIFEPIFVAVPLIATAPALIAVGWHLLGVFIQQAGRGQIVVDTSADLVPLFFTVVGMPFFHGIDKGAIAGLLVWAALRCVRAACSVANLAIKKRNEACSIANLADADIEGQGSLPEAGVAVDL